MIRGFKIFCWGWFISFLGSLPLGTLNVAAMQIGIEDGVKSAILFCLGSMLVEMIYVRLSLIGIDWIGKQQKIMNLMQWISLAIVVALAIGSFVAAAKGGVDAKNPILDNTINRFLLGAIGCAINPIVVIFWFGWSTILFEKKILIPNNLQYNFYIVGIGIGAFAGNCVFIFGGKWLVSRINSVQLYFNWIIGSIFALTALIMLFKIIRKKQVASNK